MNQTYIDIRQPHVSDGDGVHCLIAACPPLDQNSVYCNLLQCSHFAETSAIAVFAGGEIAGFVSGYIPPAVPTALFVWQVAVHPKARGCGLGKRLIKAILARPRQSPLVEVQTTITETNNQSHGTFASLARDVGADISTEVYFDRDAHFNGRHDSEVLWRIGPFAPLPQCSETN